MGLANRKCGTIKPRMEYIESIEAKQHSKEWHYFEEWKCDLDREAFTLQLQFYNFTKKIRGLHSIVFMVSMWKYNANFTMNYWTYFVRLLF